MYSSMAAILANIPDTALAPLIVSMVRQQLRSSVPLIMKHYTSDSRRTESLVPDSESRPVPSDRLDPIRPLAAKQKYIARERITAKRLGDHGA